MKTETQAEKMKASELRIGNLFDFTSEGEGYLPIEQIRKNDEGFEGYYAVFRNGSFKWLIETDGEWNIQPIPLTEEWLLKFGFQYDNDDDWYVYESKNGISLSHIIGGLTHYFGNQECLWVDILSEIKYVHQLQNLYFALTGEELQLQTK